MVREMRNKREHARAEVVVVGESRKAVTGAGVGESSITPPLSPLTLFKGLPIGDNLQF